MRKAHIAIQKKTNIYMENHVIVTKVSYICGVGDSADESLDSIGELSFGFCPLQIDEKSICNGNKGIIA